MVKHVIFDCDGVLIDTEIVAAEVVVDWLQTEKVMLSIDEFIRTHTGKMFSDIIKELQEEGRLRTDLDMPVLMRELEALIVENMRIIEGVQNTLGAVSLPKSVVSNSEVHYVKAALNKFELATHFEGRVFSAEMVEKGKPSPEVYQLAIRNLGIEKEQLIAIEDSYTGVQAATLAGIPTIGFLGGSHILDGHAERLQSLGVLGLASNHQELQQLLAKL